MDLKLSADMPEEMVSTLTNMVSEQLDATGAFSTISTQDIKQMMGFERLKDLTSCESDTSCIAEIGGALGADFLVTGSVTLLGKFIGTAWVVIT